MSAVKVDACEGPVSRPIVDEQALVHRLRKGDREALEWLIAEHQPAIRRLVGRLVGWSDETDDLVQDVFVRAIEHTGRFRGGSRISTWLTRIAVNAARAHHRKRMFRARFWKRWMERSRETESVDATESAEQRQETQRVVQAVQQLKTAEREVVVLHYLESMDIDAVASALELTRGAVEVRLHRARRKLEQMLKDDR
jgi:RNA polymerase sigma-70 factor (ECF subfamily)